MAVESFNVQSPGALKGVEGAWFILGRWGRGGFEFLSAGDGTGSTHMYTHFLKYGQQGT